MSGDVETEAARPRPLSGGLWTLFSWLRRDDASSSESLSSAGSDRTVASFAFLSPAHCRRPAPLVLPPPGPPTDSYKKRVHDRNLRRQHDRDLTLHRKYGLYRDVTVGYDVTSLPSARRSALNSDKQERERRATSESLQRRTPYVPGKRRAPPPPGASATLPHRQSRKRRAPQPPIKLKEKTKENHDSAQNMEMNPKPSTDKKASAIDIAMGCKSEKYVKKEQHMNTEVKSKQDKSFLKQIFDNKKRKSAIETSSIKILPSISELDKQAAELIELYKSKEREKNNNVLKIEQEQKEGIPNSHDSKRPRWICITCLRRFDVSVNRCSFCLSNQKPVNNSIKETNRNESIYTQTDKDLNVVPTPKHLKNNEKQELKKMLKEMKDSLPKKQKPVEDISQNDEVAGPSKGIVSITETPTLRIGSSRPQEQNSTIAEPSTFVKDDFKLSKRDSTNEIVRKILLHDNVKLRKEHLTKETTDAVTNSSSDRNVSSTDHSNKKANLNLRSNESEPTILSVNRRLHTPLKISSLLNPVYIPKSRAEITQPKPSSGSPNTGNKIVDNDTNLTNNIKTDKIISQSKTPLPVAPSMSSNMPDLLTKVETRPDIQMRQKKNSPPKQFRESLELTKTTVSTESQTSAVNRKSVTSKVDEINQHSRRRDLINQLENSIAKGDERAAADAAAKLAQLRLSCSVLSFTSQILGQLSNVDSAMQKTTKDNGNKNQQTEPHAIIKKTIVASTSSKDRNGIIERKHEISKNDATKIQAEKSEPSCSKTSTEKVNHIETFKIDAASSQKDSHEDGFMTSISVWVEDKNAARGPIKLAVRSGARLGALRQQAEAALGVPARLQRWIVGRALCSDDRAPLRALAGPTLDAPFYLCLVEYDTQRKSTSPKKDGNTPTDQNNDNILTKNDNDKTGDVYNELMLLERQALVPNTDTFECQVCMEECTAGNGVVLRECVHSFCRNCLADMIRHCEEPAVYCPAMACPGTLHEREIRALVSPEEYEKWLARGLTAAESGTRNAFHCRTRDCKGWALCEAGVRKFPCPVCKRNNCVPCQAIHEGETCEQYRTKVQEADNKLPNQTDEGTKALLDSLISRGEALECPECNAIITKKWGCDWVKCSACKTEICWVTRGRRWGPAGRGDTSAGCRCGVDGKRCHPSCGYCH